MRMSTCLTSACLTLLASTALAQSMTYDYDRAVDFSKYKRYAWTRGAELSDGLNHARVVRAIDAALAGKGLARVEPSADPDVLVAYQASFDFEVTGAAHGWGPLGLGGDWSGSARVQRVLVGTLVVEISDARTSALVWRSLASSDILPHDKPETRDRKIVKAAEKMFKTYPPRP